MVVSLGRDVFTLISLLAVMISQNPLMSLLAFLIAPGAVYGVTHLLRKVRLAVRREVMSLAQIVTVIQESVQGWKGFYDVAGVDIPCDKEHIKEICECDSEFTAGLMFRIQHVARMGELEERKN